MIVDGVGRFAGLYRRTTGSRTALALLLANAIPLFGVAFLGWSLWTVLVLYWVENGIVGFWTVPRILTAQGSLVDDVAAKARGGLRTWSNLVAARGTVDPAERARVEAELGSALDAEVAAAPAMAGVAALGSILRWPLALFFLFHYGLFWLVHGLFVFVLPAFGAFSTVGGSTVGEPFPVDGGPFPVDGGPFFPGGGGATAAHGAFGEIVWSSVLIGAAALFLSHGASFFLNYLGKGENLRTSPARAMAAPYGRVVVLHVTILFGAFAIAFIGAPIGALIVLVVAKTLFDLRLHLGEHDPA